MDFFITILIVISLGVFVFSVIIIFIGFREASEKQKKDENTIEKNIKKIRDFHATKRLKDEYGPGSIFLYGCKQNGLLIDEARHKIAVLKGAQNIKIYGYKDILEVELIEDGTSIVKTSSASAAGRAIVGGVLFGGAGAIVGGLTSEKKRDDLVKEVTLKILLNDTNNPIFTFTFFKNYEVNRDDPEYKLAIEKARKWHAYIKIAIERAEENDTQKMSSSVEHTREESISTQVQKTDEQKVSSNYSVADEIIKLKSLKEDGLLSEEEFIVQKNKLLNG